MFVCVWGGQLTFAVCAACFLTDDDDGDDDDDDDNGNDGDYYHYYYYYYYYDKNQPLALFPPQARARSSQCRRAFARPAPHGTRR